MKNSVSSCLGTNLTFDFVQVYSKHLKFLPSYRRKRNCYDLRCKFTKTGIIRSELAGGFQLLVGSEFKAGFLIK